MVIYHVDPYKVVGVDTMSDTSLPADISKDFRVPYLQEDDATNVFRLNPERRTHRSFLIHHRESVIGIATLLATPYRMLGEEVVFEDEGCFGQSKNYCDVWPCTEQTFVIEAGWFFLQKRYRQKGLATHIVSQVLIPEIWKVSSGHDIRDIVIQTMADVARDSEHESPTAILARRYELAESNMYVQPSGRIYRTSLSELLNRHLADIYEATWRSRRRTL